MLAIVFYDPFWLKVPKGLLLSALSSFIPCLALPWYVPVACSFHAISELPDDKFQTFVNFTEFETCYHLHFCHACLNLLMNELTIAQCSSFVKNHEWIPAMYCFVMFECCSIFILLHLVGHLLIIADRCYICFACHFQTVHPISVIFISISTEIISPFQWHSWFSKLRLGSIFPFRNMHMHRISHPAYHDMFCIMLLAHCTMVDCVYLCLCSCFG